MKKTITRQITIACFLCRGTKIDICSFTNSIPVMCPKCLGKGTLPIWASEEVEEEEPGYYEEILVQFS